jgi:hypothetical protein
MNFDSEARSRHRDAVRAKTADRDGRGSETARQLETSSPHAAGSANRCRLWSRSGYWREKTSPEFDRPVEGEECL